MVILMPSTLGVDYDRLGLEPTHISVEPGSKSDSIVLTIILDALKDGGKVIWMTRELPTKEES